jgi:hypothetical protein
MLYRVFRAITGARPVERGGPLYVPRERQGAGRHDSPGYFGALYAARSPESAVAEVIQAYRGRDLWDADLVLVDGSVQTLAAFDDGAVGPILDLDDPTVLVAQRWRPSGVASRDRSITQPIAVRAFQDGAHGLSWWSTLDAGWTNVTLFAERVIGPGLLVVAGEPERLTTGHPVLVAAAEHLSIGLARRRR